MRAKRLIIIIVAIVIAVLVSWDFYLHSPQYSVKQIKKSIKERQRIKFEQYVDIENLSKQAVETFINQTMLETLQENEDGWGLLGSAFGNMLFENLKPAMISLLKASIEESVENGNFQKLFSKTDLNKNISLEGMQSVFSISPNSISGYNLHTYRDLGILSLNFQSELFDTTLVLKFKIEDVGSYWKVTGFDNLEKYLANLQSLEYSVSDEYFSIEKNNRYEATINRLKDIREAEFAYKDAFGRFTGSWDTLISFLEKDSPHFVRKIAYPIEQLKMVPVIDTIAEFHLGATILTTASGLEVPVFEAKAHNHTILKNLDRMKIFNLNDQRRTNGEYPGLKVGSLHEDNGSKGNWEE